MNVPERRQCDNSALSLLVDLGVTYDRTLSRQVALAYFRASDIPPAVVERVLQGAATRRLTDWEQFHLNNSGKGACA
ncbi:hypothetical protein HF313_22140 [Massilia atriviolacea]|uniref:Uncharacterized protein n=1 Tax=Massilia atriviolacea TaxID=2495579 RepID=A0A430HFG0_9BURK|nr:hypothetical protein [Massilia atriviolacea]RSZ56268.1 hypothetical protein EJB06_25575 [Massilia atriviolacea]